MIKLEKFLFGYILFLAYMSLHTTYPKPLDLFIKLVIKIDTRIFSQLFIVIALLLEFHNSVVLVFFGEREP